MSTATPRHAVSLGLWSTRAVYSKSGKPGGNYLLFYPELWYKLCYNWFPNKSLSSSEEWATAQLCQWDYGSLHRGAAGTRLSCSHISTSSFGIIRAALPAVPQAAVIPTGSVFFPAGYLTLPANDREFSIWCSKDRWNNPLSLAMEYRVCQRGSKQHTKTRHRSQQRKQFTPFTPQGDFPATRDLIIRNQSTYFNDAEPLYAGANVVLCWCLVIQVTWKHRGLKHQHGKTLWQRQSSNKGRLCQCLSAFLPHSALIISSNCPLLPTRLLPPEKPGQWQVTYFPVISHNLCKQ